MEPHGVMHIESEGTEFDISNSVLVDSIRITLKYNSAELSADVMVGNLGSAFAVLCEKNCAVWLKNRNGEVVFSGKIERESKPSSLSPETISKIGTLHISVSGSYCRGVDFCL